MASYGGKKRSREATYTDDYDESSRVAKKHTDSGPPIPGFLQKTVQIMATPEFEPYVQWSNDGTCILITDVIGFQKYVLPRYFKHSNFPSFARQLNM